MNRSYIFSQMAEALLKLKKAKELEIEALVQMHSAELEDIVNENFIGEKPSPDKAKEAK